MRVAIAVTHESVISVVASAYETIEFCARMQRTDGTEAQVFAVSSEPEAVFRQRFGFFEFLDSRLSAPVDWVFVPALVVEEPWMPARYLPLIRWLRRAADSGALILPQHFASPSCGHIRRAGAGFTFEFVAGS